MIFLIVVAFFVSGARPPINHRKRTSIGGAPQIIGHRPTLKTRNTRIQHMGLEQKTVNGNVFEVHYV